MKNIAVFASGGGTDMQSIIDAIKEGEINGIIVLLVASKEGIGAIDRAVREGIPYKVFDKREYSSLHEMNEKIIEELEKNCVDLIVLAGYLSILTENIVKHFRNQIINIHPSLIPAYCGDGFYGMRVHRAVIENKERESGATVHYVDEGTDTGKIIMQEKVQVFEDDTPESLQKRVLEIEHKLLPKAVKELCREVNI